MKKPGGRNNYVSPRTKYSRRHFRCRCAKCRQINRHETKSTSKKPVEKPWLGVSEPGIPGIYTGAG